MGIELSCTNTIDSSIPKCSDRLAAVVPIQRETFSQTFDSMNNEIKKK